MVNCKFSAAGCNYPEGECAGHCVKPEALQLAEILEQGRHLILVERKNAGSELRRLHAEVERLNLYAAGADQLVDVWKGRAQDFMNSRDRLLNANRSLWAKMDSLRAGLLQPAVCGQWICEYPGDVFVVFDPMTDGANIVGAARTLREAGAMLDAVGQEPPAAAELRRLQEQRDALRDAAKNALNALQICGMKFEHVEAELRAAIAKSRGAT